MPTPKVAILIEAKEMVARGINAARGQLDRLRVGAGQLKDALFSVQGAIATLGFSFGVARISEFLLATNRTRESLLAQLKVLEGTRETARATFNALEDFAKSTPFQIEELTDAYIRLRTSGIAPTEEMLTAFGDLASARGKTIQDFAFAVEDAVTGEMERLKEFGIKARQSGDVVAMTFQGQTTVIRNTQDSIVAYLESLGRAQGIQGSMAEQMTTWNGVISNSMDNFGTLAQIIGEEGLNGELKGVIGNTADFTAEVNANREAIGDWTRLILASAKAIGQTFLFPVRVLFNLGQIVGRTLETILYDVNFLIVGIANSAIKGINWLIEQVNRLPQVQIDTFATLDAQQAFWWEATKAASEDVLVHTRDILDATGNLGQSYLDAARAVREFSRESERAARVSQLGSGDGAGGGGGGGGGAGGDLLGKDVGKEIQVLAQAKKLRALSAKDLGRAFDLEDQILARLRDQNLALQERVTLRARLKAIQGVTGGHPRPRVATTGDDLPFRSPIFVPDRRDRGARIGDAIRDAIGSAETFEQVVADMISGTIGRFGDAVSEAFEAFVDGSQDAGEAFKNAMLGSLAAVAKGLGDFYAGKAVAAIAEGLATKDPAQWAAAAKYMAAATAMYGVAGTASGLASGGGGGGGATEATRDTERLSGTAKGEAVVVLKGGWKALLQDPEAQDSFQELMEDLSDRRVTVRYG